MLTLKQFLSIELKTRLQLLEWRDSPLLKLTIDRQLELLKEIKILLTLSDGQKHKKETIYVRKFWGHQLAFSKFLEKK